MWYHDALTPLHGMAWHDVISVVRFLACPVIMIIMIIMIHQVTAVNAVEDEELKQVNEKEANELENRLKAAGVPFEP